MDAFSFLRRRTLLKLGLGGLGALALGGGGLVALRGTASAVSGLRVLDAHRFRTLLAIVQAQLPLEIDSGGAVGERLARLFDGFLEGEHEENVNDLKTALLLVEYGPVLFERRLTTFSNLPFDERRRHWRAWMESDLALRRQVSLAFRKFLHVVFFDDPAVWPQIGYPGPSLWGMPKVGAIP